MKKKRGHRDVLTQVMETIRDNWRTADGDSEGHMRAGTSKGGRGRDTSDGNCL